ncbi:hypothetical protein H257_07589 [Aphanomyces astaci]|uniref:Man1/Src1 C-terminal domain-containing protein n=1 Tax=Aphanomyces astaci TaxID=112090 RepID=W4GHI1_APHAT|nr:hypothetical protein H257_07589 [Aphanomyces astaci]ETV78746.1 hypothetical protein H257_07589 [Aphanomyces astaci]|eukprot:XP_009831465.1 hypothetical protein H257_07589 [Aphanomyces astaci]
MVTMPTDDLLSPASKLLSPVTRLNKAKDIMNEEQRKRMAALSDQRIREAIAKDPVTRTLRRPTSSATALEPSKLQDTYSVDTKNSIATDHRPEPQRRVHKNDSVDITDIPSTVRSKSMELERSYELLRRLKDEDIRAKLRKQAVKENVVPTSNYHLKHYGLADSDRINIYAPFEGSSSTDVPKRMEPSLGQQPRERRLPPHAGASSSSRHAGPVNNDDDIPQLIRRKAVRPPPPPAHSRPTQPQAPTPSPISSKRKASKQPRVTRTTPMKTRLRARQSSVPWAWLGHLTQGAGIACGLVTLALVLAQDHTPLVHSVAAHGMAALESTVQVLSLHHRSLLIAGLVVSLGLLLWLSQGLSASDQRTIERLVVCAKEELLLHATSNLPGHTAIPEAYLREAILDLLGYKGPTRVKADSLWPSVRHTLGTDSRIQCFQARSKRGLFLWEWVAPQSQVAMNRYAAAVTTLRNEHVDTSM